MVRARKLEKRQKAIRNIQKITRTMELIATARFKKAWDRVQATMAYSEGLFRIIQDLAKLGLCRSQPLWEPKPNPKRVFLLVLGSNRGLCGGYNAGIVRQTMDRLGELQAQDRQPVVEVSGKRVGSALRFRHVPIQALHTHLADRPKWQEVELLAQQYLEQFQKGHWDCLEVLYTSSETVARHRIKTDLLLPIPKPEASTSEVFPPDPRGLDLYPSAEDILSTLLPRFFKVRLFLCFLQAALSEQIARMFAMKTATENTEKMLHRLALAHHRARQTQITSEILELLSGAEALQPHK
ncbi:MAG: ATP synthase F1 subunit gamma [Thermoguttaceae bacterium]|nr:ATP synthase F1 subunit gamma [Thermoguttaceae bacterium]MDW8039392.1 ATP synthase F1 subunit gamma [Thermoguttaceae bacterium]